MSKDDENDTFDLFEPHKLARADDPDTSKEAANSLEGDLSRLRAAVLKAIEDAGMEGLTLKELQLMFSGTTGGTISSRPNELRKQGLVFHVENDKRGTPRKGNVIRSSKYKIYFIEEDGKYYTNVNLKHGGTF